MILTDRMTFDAPKRTKEGYMAVRARAARAGIYDYLGAEVDPTGAHFKANDVVKVYRPPEVVFDAANMRSFVMRPITNDHPSEAVTAENWSDLAKGVIAGAVKDGDYLGFDLAFFDAATIRDIDSGKRELSNGYQAELAFGDGVTPSGEAYNAIQTSQTGNHVALVDRGRAGPACAIGVCDAMSDAILNRLLVDLGDDDMTTKPVKITIDGASHTVDLSDAAAILVGQMQTMIDRQAVDLTAAQTTIGTLTASVSTKDGEIAALTKRVKDAEAVDVDTLVANRAKVVDAAKKIFPDVVTDKKSDAEIRQQAVAHKLGDAAATMDANGIAGAFAAFAASVTDSEPDTLRDGLRTVDKSNPTNDAHAGYLARLTRKTANAA